MGNNLITGCHKCKVKVFHFRNEENVAILPFYKKHSDCIREDHQNVETIMDNNGYEPEWADNDGYGEDSLQPHHSETKEQAWARYNKTEPKA